MQRRIAMWSGPRNISTAMMRSWGARTDTVVCDEPLYAHYLLHTGYTHHPGYEEILAHDETDWRKVVDYLLGPIPAGKSVYYQKQMAHHLLPHISLDWTNNLDNVFLIRQPAEMLLSLVKFFPEPALEETGLPQQVNLFERLRTQRSAVPLVVDAKDVLRAPRAMLSLLCQELDLPFEEAMLHWRSGIHSTDGVWARLWYENTTRSTTFAPYQTKSESVPSQLRKLLDECQALYEVLAKHKLRPPTDSP